MDNYVIGKITNDEQFLNKIVMKLVLDMIAADGIVTGIEKVAIEKSKEILKLSPSEFEEANRMSSIEALYILKQLQSDAKKATAKLLETVMALDGIDEEEEKLFRFVCNLAEIPYNF
jgi:uncharacterized tellurite resistance protein B-like protein